MNDPEQLVKLVDNIVEKANLKQRNSFLQPGERLSAYYFNKTVDRESAMDTAISYITDPKKSERNPILATFAAPGSGKTHFLDEVLYLNQNNNFNFSYIPIHVSFNSFTEISEIENTLQNDQRQYSLYMRLLYW